MSLAVQWLSDKHQVLTKFSLKGYNDNIDVSAIDFKSKARLGLRLEVGRKRH